MNRPSSSSSHLSPAKPKGQEHGTSAPSSSLLTDDHRHVPPFYKIRMKTNNNRLLAHYVSVPFTLIKHISLNS